ncbi:MAG: E2/UBC family protein [Candidatus Thiodiazotropha sp. L084R]
MSDNGLKDVHHWLLSQGYKEDSTQIGCYAYKGIVTCNKVQVPICLSFQDLTFQELPNVHLLEPRPVELTRPLPHVDYRGKLCYLDQESYRIDPYNIVMTMATLLDRVKRVLTDSVSRVNSEDVGYEFTSYWESHDLGAILSQASL